MHDILIIGGSRFVGPYLIKKLLLRGSAITVFNRGAIETSYQVGVSFIRGNRNNGFNISKHFDVVIDMCAYNGYQTELAVKELNFDFFIHMGTAAAYKKSDILPLTENSPLGDWPLWGSYNNGKVECEKVLEGSGIKYASIRPVYILGPKNYCDREHFIYSKIKHDKPIIIPGNGLALIQFISLNDVVESMIMLSEKKISGSFNCAGNESVTLNGLIENMAKIVGKKPVIQFNPNADGERWDAEEFPFANENFIVSNEKLKNIGMVFTPLSSFLRKDYENYYKTALL